MRELLGTHAECKGLTLKRGQASDHDPSRAYVCSHWSVLHTAMADLRPFLKAAESLQAS